MSSLRAFNPLMRLLRSVRSSNVENKAPSQNNKAAERHVYGSSKRTRASVLAIKLNASSRSLPTYRFALRNRFSSTQRHCTAGWDLSFVAPGALGATTGSCSKSLMCPLLPHAADGQFEFQRVVSITSTSTRLHARSCSHVAGCLAVKQAVKHFTWYGWPEFVQIIAW